MLVHSGAHRLLPSLTGQTHGAKHPNSFFKTGGPRVTKQMYNRLNYRNELISVSTKQVMEMAHPSIRSMILASVIGLTALSTADAHPLDSLSPAEISAVVEILRAEGKVTADARYPLIELKEPDKSTVLAWKQSDPGPRVATVNVKAADGVYKGEVDLTAHRVLAWNRASGQPMVLFEEFFGAMDLVLANPEFVAGLAKRGLKADQVFCLPLTAGAFGTPDEAGRRLMKVPCYVKPEGSNFYAKPVEGLLAVVDLAAKKVLKVLDTGVLPVPKDSWGYTEAEVEKRAGMLRPVGNPVVLQQSGGANVQINGSAVSWDIWRFRWRVDKRPGLVLSQIEVNDGTR
jgi:primary-amine oxidase